MKCLPAIDILDGKCVRLTKGDFDKSKIYNGSPLDQAKIFENAGFKEIHIVDLNGAKSGNRINLPIISKIASTWITLNLNFFCKTVFGSSSFLMI